jgi:hypothetical protein
VKVHREGSSEIVIYSKSEKGKAFVHANCMFVHGAELSERKRPYCVATEKNKIQNKQNSVTSISGGVHVVEMVKMDDEDLYVPMMSWKKQVPRVTKCCLKN